MRVLLTGAAGFIGAAVRRALEAAGHDVVAVDLFLPQAHRAAPPDPDVHVLDVVDADSWRDLLEGVGVVLHQAAMVGAGVHVSDLPLFARHNDLGTAALLAAMGAADVGALVLASSMVVYGEGRYACAEHGRQPAPPRQRAALDAGDFEVHCPVCGRAMSWQPVPEDAELDPRGGYAASKVAQEHYARAWARQTGGRVLALRYHNVYGPHMPRDTPYAGVAAIFRSALAAGRPPQVFEDGGQVRDFVHVDDVARANLLALDAVVRQPAESWQAVNVCSGRPITIAEVAALLAAAVGGPAPVVTGGHRPADVRHVVASPVGAVDLLGFRAGVSPTDGIPAFADAPLRG
jgi:dTDP-L-rhamnose 4-epimerase